MIVVYFDNLDAEKISIKIGILRAFDVSDQKPVCIKVYDYYDTSKLRIQN
jgi:hypothetical protein